MIMQKQTDAVTKQRGAAKTQPPEAVGKSGSAEKNGKEE